MNNPQCPIAPIFKPGLWYAIPGFNGYEINCNYVVRSCKNFNKYPNGYFIKNDTKNLSNPDTYKWRMSDNSNVVRTMTLNDILIQFMNNPSRTAVTTQGSYVSRGSRNRIIADPEAYKASKRSLRGPGFTVASESPDFAIPD